jgi:type IX secretion system substrate protein
MRRGKIQIYPNPFSQSTQISFTSQSAGYAEISIVNLLGEQVAHIFSGELDEGQHNFTFSNISGLQDGTYECLIRMNGRVETLPIVLLH